MAQFVDGPARTFTAGAAIPQHARVKLSSGVLVVAVAGTTDEVLEIGTMEKESFASGDIVAVRLRSAAGTHKMIASAAIAEGVAVYGAVDGEIATTSSGAAIGVSMEAAGADQDIIEVLRF